MAKKKEALSTKRFGPRYGRSIKKKLALIEKEYKKKHKCESCNATKVKRVAAGIWQCQKCGNKFAAKAYSPKKTKIKIQTEVE